MRFLLLPLGIVYSIITTLRNFCYDVGIFKITKMSIPVISVGNITAGGTGKTPITIHLAEEAKVRGFKPGIVSRGYGRKSRGLQLVHDGREFKGTVENCGDEPFLMASLLNDVPVIVCENKVKGANYLIDMLNVDVILLDDGFQHRKIYREVDIVLMNASETPSAYSMLPMGFLREPLSNLYRADYTFITKGDRENIPSKAKRYIDNIIEPKITYQLKKYIKGKIIDVEIPDFELFAFCGIAHPQSFFDSIKLYGIRMSNSLSFSDHVTYDKKAKSKILGSMPNNGKGLITTEKDLVKLSDSFLDIFDVYILTMNFSISSPELDKIFYFMK